MSAFSMRLRPLAVFAALCAPVPLLAAWDVADTGQSFDDVRISVSEGSWMSVDVSPDGKTLVFDLLGDLFLMPATGGEAKVLRQGPAFDRNPHFSPDGRQIAFISDGNGYDNAWVINVDGSGAREISGETGSAYVGTPAWTADGSYVMARRFSPNGRRVPLPFGNHLWLYHTAGGAGRKIVEAPNSVAEPTLSRDGRWLYYTQDSSPFSFSKPAPDGANFVIKRHDLATGQSSTLVTGYAGAFTPQISPNGELLAFVRRVATKDVLFVYELKTGRQRPVFDGLSRDMKVHNMLSGFYPSYGWFPDNRHVAIWGKGKLFNIDTVSGEARPIPFHVDAQHRITRAVRFERSFTPPAFAPRAIGIPATSPDGKTLVFGAIGHLWKKRLPGGKPERLTGEADYVYDPAFSPDGRLLLSVGWSDELGSTLQLRSLDGKKLRDVLSVGAIVSHPRFSPDASKIAFQIEPPTPQLGGYHLRPGLYWVAASGGELHLVTAAGSEPVFSPNGDRLYFNLTNQGSDQSSLLKSVALDGTDPREHLRSAEAHHFRLSPDGRWVAFQENFGIYVAPYLETGTPMTISATSGIVPIRQLTRHRGNHYQWFADGRRLGWVSGSDFVTAAIGDDSAPGSEPTRISLGLEVDRDVPAGKIAFTGARIISMTGPAVIEDGVLVVERDRIVAVGPKSTVAIPADAKRIDVTGKTLMPGLIDAHAHLMLGQVPDDITPQKYSRYYANLAYGVTTTFDPAAPTQFVFRLSELVQAGRMVGPRIFSTGEIFMGYPSDPVSDVRVTSLDSARDHVLRQKETGAIAIKSYVQPGRIERQQLVKAARELGVMAMPEGEGQFDHDLTFVLDGYTTVEHNLPNDTLYDDVIQLFAHSGTASTPTLMVNQAELNGMQYFYQSTRIWEIEKLRNFTPVAKGWDRWNKPLWAHQRTLTATDEVYEIGTRSVARSLKKLSDAGVLVNLGSHGEIDGIGAIWELWLIQQGGMSNYDVLRVGTINPARSLGMDKQIGTLEAGKLADLIVLDGNPLADIKALDTVRYTMVNGRLYDARSMNEIGNYDRPRGKFHWEVDRHPTIDWDESMIGDVPLSQGGSLSDEQ
jgi:Tol biopolymer transport system component